MENYSIRVRGAQGYIAIYRSLALWRRAVVAMCLSLAFMGVVFVSGSPRPALNLIVTAVCYLAIAVAVVVFNEGHDEVRRGTPQRR